jgi:predicted unusual protein kinase regulating ubiquinone biosynthesis (AarF/ABC1/UbiB family)
MIRIRLLLSCFTAVCVPAFPLQHTSRLQPRSLHVLRQQTPFVAVPESASSPLLGEGRALGRAGEIGRILVTEVFFPLVGSVARSGLLSTDTNFWQLDTGNGKTNAERICQALESLGPTYVKFGQALASRADLIPPSLANALLKLQDQMEPFSTLTAKEIILEDLAKVEGISSEEISKFMESLSEEPVAAASIGQVYKGWLEGVGDVAVKVKRPGIHDLVERDAALLQSAALWVESLPGWKSDRLIAARIVDAVDEFMARIFEELDYNREVQNMQTFAELYSIRRGTSKLIKVVVPEVVPGWSTENMIVMEWIDGVKLDVLENDDAAQIKENLAVIEMGTSAKRLPMFCHSSNLSPSHAFSDLLNRYLLYTIATSGDWKTSC